MSFTKMRDRSQYVTEDVGVVDIHQVLGPPPVAYDFTSIHLTSSGPFSCCGLLFPWAATFNQDFSGYSKTIEHEAYTAGRSSFLTVLNDDIPARYKHLDGNHKNESMKVLLLRNGLDLDDVEPKS